MNRKLITIAAAAAAAVLAGSGYAAAAVTTAAGAHSRPSCVVVTFGWRTVTGHEANEPVTVCGTGLRHDQICQLSEPLQPGAVADCYAVRPRR